MLVDSHCHLNFADFNGQEEGGKSVAEVVENALKNGVGFMLSIATDFNELNDVRETVAKYDNVFAGFGIHPEYARTTGDFDVDDIAAVFDNPKFIGVGETGLDFSFEEAADLKTQEKLFRAHIAVARGRKLPLIVHTRAAERDTLRILEDEAGKSGDLTGVLHCFTGSRQMAFKALDMGFYISVSGIITFGKSAEEIRNTIKEVPLDRLLVETDAPFLAPVPKRGGRNEPAFVRYTAEKLAELKGVDIEEIENQTTENFFKLFNKAVK